MVCDLVFSEPQTTLDCVSELRAQMNFTMPSTDEGWMDAEVTEIDVRRDFVLVDALKEGRKKRFDPRKLLKVSSHILLVKVEMIECSQTIQ